MRRAAALAIPLLALADFFEPSQPIERRHLQAKGEPILPGVKPYLKEQYRWIKVAHAFGLASPNPAEGAWDVRYVQPSGSNLATCTVRDEVPDCG